MQKLYAHVSDDVLEGKFDGLLMASATPEDAEAFTEKGYGLEGSLVEVEPRAVRYAGEKEVIAAAKAAGIRVYETYEQFAAAAGPAEVESEDVLVLEEKPLNIILQSPHIQRAVEAAGYEAAKGLVVITNYEAEFWMFWNRSTFEVSVTPAPTA